MYLSGWQEVNVFNLCFMSDCLDLGGTSKAGTGWDWGDELLMLVNHSGIR